MSEEERSVICDFLEVGKPDDEGPKRGPNEYMTSLTPHYICMANKLKECDFVNDFKTCPIYKKNISKASGE
jgi:hypothetical protein